MKTELSKFSNGLLWNLKMNKRKYIYQVPHWMESAFINSVLSLSLPFLDVQLPGFPEFSTLTYKIDTLVHKTKQLSNFFYIFGSIYDS